jgi:hypothetical protein
MYYITSFNRIIIHVLPVVVYWCETWSVALREKHRLRVWLLRKISGPNRNEVIGNWRRLHNEELHDLYSTLNNIRVIKSRWAVHVASLGEKRGAYRVSVGKSEVKRQLGTTRLRWKDDIK